MRDDLIAVILRNLLAIRLRGQPHLAMRPGLQCLRPLASTLNARR
jgi:hypothetical protein